MYSMVLMAALTTGTATPDCHWHSCHGGGYGCYGGGCYGGCYGSGYSHGCWGGCYGGGYGCYGYSGYYGCYGGWSCYGSGYSCYGGVMGSPYNPVGPIGPGRGPEPLPNPQEKKPEETSRAKVIIDVPAEAALFIDGQQMAPKAGQRTFLTPPLQAGQTYYYDVRLVVTQNGQRSVQETRVLLHPGEVVTAAFGRPQAEGTATAQSSGR